MFLFQLLYTEWAYPDIDANQYFYEWTFEPKEDGSVHVKVQITIGELRSSYRFSFPKDYPVEIIRVLDVGTLKDINYTKTEEEDKIIYIFEFEGEKEKGFQFLVEFDQLNKVEETDEVYYFYWEWIEDQIASHTAAVILPEKHELLSAESLGPVEILLYEDQTFVGFEEKILEPESFEFGVTFSKKGKELIEEAEIYFNQGKYYEARSAYLEAIEFYKKFPLLDRNKDEFLAELQIRAKEIEYILEGVAIYDWTFEPDVDGSVHVKVQITLGSPYSSYSLRFPEGSQVEPMRAMDTEWNPISYIITEHEDKMIYIFKFEGEKEKGFQFLVEFDQLNKVEETDEVYYFYWEWIEDQIASHTAAVILPKEYELLSTEYLDLMGILLDQDQISIKFKIDVSESEPFEFGVTFSKKGKELIEKGERYFNLGIYYDARKAYLEAIEFYSNSEFSIVNNRNTDEFLTELEERVENVKRTEYVQGKFTYDWTFEPEEDGSVHVRVEITLGGPCSSYQFNFPKDCSVKSIRAMDEDWNLIEYTYTEEEDLTYIFEFDTEKEKGFKFTVEFDLENEVEKTEKETYYFYWKWTKIHRTSHTATVILPQEHNLLFTSPLTPKETYSMGDHTFVIFWKDVSELELFEFEVSFSEKDVTAVIWVWILLPILGGMIFPLLFYKKKFMETFRT